MMRYQTYQLWQIERPKTTAEQRAADARVGIIAAAVSRSARRAARTTLRAAAPPPRRMASSVRPRGAQMAVRAAR